MKKTVTTGGQTTTTYGTCPERSRRVGNYYDVEVAPGGSQTKTSYYYFASLRVAMKRGTTVTYLYGDHLGSSSVATKDNSSEPKWQTYCAGACPERSEGGRCAPATASRPITASRAKSWTPAAA